MEVEILLRPGQGLLTSNLRGLNEWQIFKSDYVDFFCFGQIDKKNVWGNETENTDTMEVTEQSIDIVWGGKCQWGRCIHIVSVADSCICWSRI